MQTEIEQIFDQKPDAYTEEHFRLFYEFKDALNQGRIRAAQPAQMLLSRGRRFDGPGTTDSNEGAKACCLGVRRAGFGRVPLLSAKCNPQPQPSLIIPSVFKMFRGTETRIRDKSRDKSHLTELSVWR